MKQAFISLLDADDLSGYYSQVYHDIVRPNQIWSVTKYFLRRWSRYFPSYCHFWAVVAARQMAYRNQNRPWFRAYDGALAIGAGTNVDNFRRRLKSAMTDPAEEAIGLFLSHESTTYERQGDQTRPAPTRYHIRLDDPLVPADADHLAGWLRAQRPAFPATPAGLLLLLQRARELPAAELQAPGLLDGALPAPGALEALTAADVVGRVFGPLAQDEQVQEAAEALHAHIVSPLTVHIGSHYFRHQWLPILDPGPAFLIAYLRSFCYHNATTGEIRNEVTVTLPELGQALGLGRNTLPRWLQKIESVVPEQPFGPFLRVVGKERVGNAVYFTFAVNLDEPLTPTDLERYRAQVAAEVAEERAGAVTQMPAAAEIAEPHKVGHTENDGAPERRSHVEDRSPTKSGTPPRPETQKVVHASASAAPQSRPHWAGGSPEKSFTIRAADPQSRPRPGTQPQKVGAGGPESRPMNYYTTLATALEVDLQDLLETGSGQGDPWRSESGRAGLPFAAAAVGTLDNLLAMLDIHGKGRRQIQAGGLDLEALVAWYLYALAQEWTIRPIGYLIQRAAAGEPPPELYARLSRLSWELWRTHAVAAGLRPLLAPEQFDRLGSLPGFQDWEAAYGDQPLETLPFDVGAGLDEIRALLEARGKGDALRPNGHDTVGVATAVSPADAAAWSAALQELSLQMTRATFDTLLKGARLVSRSGNEYVIGVQNQSAKEWLENRLGETVARTIAVMAGAESTAVRFVAAADDY